MLSYEGNAVNIENCTINNYYKDTLEIIPSKTSGVTVLYSIRSDNKDVGEFIISFLDSSSQELYLAEININPYYRNRGLGTKVINWLIEFGKKFGNKNITLLVDFDNEKAQSLYKRLGFNYCDQIFDYCYKMELILNDSNK